MVETKYKDHRNHEKPYQEQPSTVEWMGIVLVITGAGLAFLTVAQKLESNYYGIGLVLVGLGSAFMFYRLPVKGGVYENSN
jgi:hypothetical protein